MEFVRTRYAIVSAVIAFAAVLAPDACRADWVERQQPIAHAIYVPKNYDAAKKYPLAIVIHGNGNQGNDNRVYKGEPYSKFLSDEKVQAEYPHFIYVPQCPGGQTWVGSPWEKGSYSVDAVPLTPTMTKLTDILKGLMKEYSIDTSRIYVTGISMGGQATWDLMCRYPSLFAAAVPVCGCGDPSKAGLLTGVGIWAFHGANDPTIPVKSDRDMMAGLETAGMKVLRLNNADPTEQPQDKHIFSEYNVGHNVWNQASDLSRFVIPWMFAQSRSAGTAVKTPPSKPALKAVPLAGGSASKPAAATGDKGTVCGGATFRVGMTKAEVMDQISKNPGSGWYVPELDAPPTGELFKMDKWGLGYKKTGGANPGGGFVTLIFVGEKISTIEGGGER